MPTEVVLATVAERPEATVDNLPDYYHACGALLLAAPYWAGALLVSSFGAESQLSGCGRAFGAGTRH